MSTRRGFLQALIATPAAAAILSESEALATPVERELPPHPSGWKPAWRTCAGSFAAMGYLGTCNDYVTQMMLICTEPKRPVRRIVCGVPVYTSFRATMISSLPLNHEVTAEALLKLHDIDELPFMGAKVTWSRDLRDDVMIFFDTDSPTMPREDQLVWNFEGPWPKGVLGWITGWMA